jgi:uncharacterized caspase-like protein
VVLLFLSGHGINERGKFYFLTKDSVIENNRVNPEYSISEEAIKAVLDAPGRRLIFIDACQSGGMDINQFMYSLRRTNAYMLSSSEGDKPSYENFEWNEHGIFAYSVIQGLRGDARPANSENISVLKLYDYVHKTVMDETKDFPKNNRNQPQQKPVQYSWGFSDFDIAR